MNFRNYLKEVGLVFKEHYILILIVVIFFIVLKFITIPFVSLLLLLILMFYLSKTKEYKHTNLIGKLFQFGLFVIFLILFLLIILLPTAIISVGLDNLTAETIYNSNAIGYATKMGAYLSILFIFAPYRIFDAGENIFKAIKYSCLLVKNNFVIFLVVSIFLLVINYFTINIDALDEWIYMLGLILTVAIYRLNVKQTLMKGEKNEYN